MADKKTEKPKTEEELKKEEEAKKKAAKKKAEKDKRAAEKKAEKDAIKTTNIEIAKVERELARAKKQLAKDQDNLTNAKKAVNVESSTIVQKDHRITTKALKEYVENAEVAYSNKQPLEAKSKASDAMTKQKAEYGEKLNLITQYLKEYMMATNDVEGDQQLIANLEAQKKRLESQKKKKSVDTSATPSAEGHIYPVAMVVKWTKELNQWNDRLDKFIQRVEETGVNIDITWLCKKCEWLCRKINYALAVLRYEIIKCLGGLFKKVKEATPMLEAIANVSVASLGTVITLGKSVVNYFTKPYKVLIQFIQDFMTYTPPLIESATELVTKSATVPVVILSNINLKAQDTTDGKTKELAEVYKQYINIKMDPITLADIMSGGDSLKKPAIAEFSPNRQQYTLLTNQVEVLGNEMFDTWLECLKDIDKTVKNSLNKLPNVTTKSVEKIGYIAEDNFDEYYIDIKPGQTKNTVDTARLVYEMAVAESDAKKAKAKAQEKATKAQEKAKRAQEATRKKEEAASKHILDDKLVAEAEKAVEEASKAKEEADKAKAEADKIDTTVKIPYGTTFNTVRYPVYPILTTKSFAGAITRGYMYDSMYNHIISYYTKTFCSGNASKIKVDAESENHKSKQDKAYIDLLKLYSPVFPVIAKALDKIKELVIKQYKLEQEANQLNRKSIFS